MYFYIRYGYPKNKLYHCAVQTFENEFDCIYIRDKLEVFMSRFFANQFKRNNLTEGPKIGTVSLSPRGDWRMPSDISY